MVLHPPSGKERDYMIQWFKGLIEDSIRKAVSEQVNLAVSLAVADQVKAAMVSVAEKVEQVEIDYDDLASSLLSTGLDYHQIAENIDLSDLISEFDTDEVVSKVANEIDTDDIVQRVVDDVDSDDIAERVRDNIEIDYSEIEIDYAELGKALVALVARSA